MKLPWRRTRGSGWLLLAACAATPPPATTQAAPTTRANTPEAPAPPARGALVPIADAAYGYFRFAPDAPAPGDLAPDFELPLIDGSTFSLAEARDAGPVVVMFYRGFW